MTRFKVGEQVIIKLQNRVLGRAVISNIFTQSLSNLTEYELSREHPGLPLWALDNKDRCIYSALFPPWRIYKLEEV